jgi:hypothetical protein
MILAQQIEDLVRSNFFSFQDDEEHVAHMIGLHKDFIPGPFDVICARGKRAKNHIGNQRFRQKIKEVTQAYADAESRLYKSLVVSSVIDYVRKESPNGGFVKEVDGVWYDVGDQQAREKVGQALRDQLHPKYRSSTKSKRRRWKQEEEERVRNGKKHARNQGLLDQLMQKNQDICNTMKLIEASRLEAGGDDASDELMVAMFTESNRSLLQAVKADPILQQEIEQLANKVE